MVKNYLMICEIGPIHDFTKASRKTADFWGASFLFSYLMARVAAVISQNGGTLFLPFLDDNPLYLAAKGEANGEKIYCGSVPDQIYAVVPEDKKGEIATAVKDTVSKVLDEIAEIIRNQFSETKPAINKNELSDFFNFFFIFHDMQERSSPDYEKDFIPAEEKIKMRGLFRPFDKAQEAMEIKKWDKCSLCGDRAKVVSINVDNSEVAALYNKEHICSVCLLKRYLPKIADEIHHNIQKPSYESTSDIAAVPVVEAMDVLKESSQIMKQQDEKLQEAYQNFIKEFEPDSGKSGRRFFEARLGAALAEFRKTYQAEAKEAKIKPTPWLSRPFYAVVYMDGDNLGGVLKENHTQFKEYITSISGTLSAFANSVFSTINDFKGQLIFAGGEDIVFMIHPEYLLDCIAALNGKYKSLFDSTILDGKTISKMTLSAGAFICYHKYPLSKAIEGAAEMLFACAKEYSGKNATAIKLIKGHSEALSFTFSNERIADMAELKRCLETSHISRTTPYRIRSQELLFKQLADQNLQKAYLKSILAGTRGSSADDALLDKLTDKLMKFGDIQTMVDALLYTRFLLGDKS